MKPTEAYIPNNGSILQLREAVQRCRGCPLYKNATQAVFGEGTREGKLMLIGEQPGDQEDKTGRPFVGPAGKVLRAAMAEAGLTEKDVYVTNAVKHFKWKPGPHNRRLHQKPNRNERLTCLPWLEAEIEAVRPEIILCLGATAAQSMFGDDFRLTKHRGEVLQTTYGIPALATLHPSAILRMREEVERNAARQQLVEDLKAAKKLTNHTVSSSRLG